MRHPILSKFWFSCQVCRYLQNSFFLSFKTSGFASFTFWKAFPYQYSFVSYVHLHFKAKRSWLAVQRKTFSDLQTTLPTRQGSPCQTTCLFWLCKLFAYFIWYKSLENLDKLFWIYCNFLNSRIFCPFGYNIEKLSKL